MSKQQIATQFSGLPLKALIGAPLKAASDANAMLAQAQTQFLLSTCFERAADDDYEPDKQLRPVMVTFEVERQVLTPEGKPSDRPLKMSFSLPLMMLIPISTLAIENLKIDFQVEVKSSSEFKRETPRDRVRRARAKGIETDYKAHEFDTELHGALSQNPQESKTGKDATTANYSISLTAGQLPLPTGVTTILDIFSKNLNPLPAPKPRTD